MRLIGRCRLGCVTVIVTTCASPALAEMLPLWEVGGGVAAISFPDYRGSASRRGYLLPVPVLVYRGAFPPLRARFGGGFCDVRRPQWRAIRFQSIG